MDNKLSKKSIKWWRSLRRQRRISILNATDLKEEWHIHISPANIIAALLSFVLLLFIIILSLVAYTPVLEFLPGYRTDANKSRESLIQNMIKLDSMERMMNDMMTYNQNIALIMDGKTPVIRTISNSDSTIVTKVLVMPSHEDSLLRVQMEGSGEYSLNNSAPSRRTVRESIEKITPVEGGIILDRFDIKGGNFGVRIAASSGARVSAIDNGTVIMNVWTPETGHIVGLQHAGDLVSIYKNMSQTIVATGQTIKSGEMIGSVAESEAGGKDKAKPFEFELWDNGKPVDPEGYIVF